MDSQEQQNEPVSAEGPTTPTPKKPSRLKLWIRRIRLTLSILTLLIIIGGVYFYYYWTDPDRVEVLAEEFLADFAKSRVTIESAEFSMLGGIRLTGVAIYEADNLAAGPADRTNLPPITCQDIQLKLSLPDMLAGRFRVLEVEANRPSILVLRDEEADELNIEGLFQSDSDDNDSEVPHLPRLRLRDMQIGVGTRQASGNVLEKRLVFSLIARPGSQAGTYRVQWLGGQQIGTGGEFEADLNRISFTDIRGGLPWLSVEGVMLAADTAFGGLRQWTSLLGLSGELQVRDFDVQGFRQEGDWSGAIDLRNAALSIPVDNVEEPLPSDERYLRFTGVNGRLDVSSQRAKAEFTAQFHGSDCLVSVEFERGDVEITNLLNAGFEAQMELREFALPSCDDQSAPEQMRFLNRFSKIAKIFNDFDPQGVVNLTMAVHKRPGADEPIVLKHVYVDLLNTSFVFHRFPYRVENLRGKIAFRPDGILIENLRGRRNNAAIRIDGSFASMYRWSEAQIVVQAQDIALDWAVYDALKSKFRRIWDLFEIEGSANVEVRLNRPQGTPNDLPSWRTTVMADLLDVSAVYRKFPYPVKHLFGRLTIDSNGLTMKDFSGTGTEGVIAIDGEVEFTEGHTSAVDIEIDACDLPIDDVLIAAMPAGAQREVLRFNPRGRFDAYCRLTDGPELPRMRYDVQADVRNVACAYYWFPLPLHDLSGTLHISPEEVAFDRMVGRWRDTVIQANAVVDLRQDRALTHVELDFANLMVNSALERYLPPAISRVTQSLGLRGLVDVETTINHKAGTGDKLRHFSVVDARGVNVTLEGFPLPVTDVRGRAVVDGDRVGLQGVTGRHEGASFGLSGWVNYGDDDTTGLLELTTTGMHFTEALRQAVPWRMRRAWNNIKPAGIFDLNLHELSFRLPQEGLAEWGFAGELSLADTTMNVGIPLDRLNGSVSGSGKLTSAVGGLDLECDLDLSSAVLVNREITDIQGHMSRSASLEQLDITELRGRLAGGRVAGTVGVNYGATGSAYSVETTLSNVSLDGLLERDDQDEPGPQLGGFVDASLYMNGRLGKSDSLRGGGRVSIAEARMFETPVLVSVLNVLGLAPPDTEPRQSIAGEFHLLGDRIGLKDIVLRDNTVGLIGSGQLIREPLEMDMRLVAVRPNGWFRIPLVTELLEGAARELVELRVTGSLDNPKVSAHALPGVEEAVDLLFEDDRSVQGRSSSPRS